MRDAADHWRFVVCQNHWKVLDQTFTVAYLHVVSFAKNEKDTVTEVYIKPSKISMMEFLEWFSALNYFCSLSLLQKSHHGFLIWLKYASGLQTWFLILQYIFISCIRDSIKVLNGQDKYVKVASQLKFHRYYYSPL